MKKLLRFSIVAALLGCSKQVTKTDLVGYYVANYPAAMENLTLLSNGIFTQQVTIRSTSQVLVTNGIWIFDSGDKRITLKDNFINVLDGFGHPKVPAEPGTAMLPVIRRFGKLQIGEDPTVEYKKQPGP